MTALQELAQLKAGVASAQADLSAASASLVQAQSDLSAVTAERDALATEKASLIAERDALAAKLADAEKANRDFAAQVEQRAAQVAVEQLAAVGAAPVPVAGADAPVTDYAALLAAESDPVKRTLLFRQHTKNIRRQANAARK